MRTSAKLFLVLCFVGLCWTSSAADHRNGYTFRGGKVLMFKEGKDVAVTAEVRLKNGIRLLPDGFIIYADGRRERFVEERWFDLDGEVIVVDAAPVDFDGYWVEGGKVYVMRERRPVLVTVEVSLNDGSRLMPDGVLILKSGTRSHLGEGHRITRAGVRVEARATTETHRNAEPREKAIDTSRKIEDNAKTRTEEHGAKTVEKREEKREETTVKTPAGERAKVEEKREETSVKTPAGEVKREEKREEKHEEKK